MNKKGLECRAVLQTMLTVYTYAPFNCHLPGDARLNTGPLDCPSTVVLGAGIQSHVVFLTRLVCLVPSSLGLISLY